MVPEYSILPFSLDRFLLIKELFRSAFESEIAVENFSSKYDTKKTGHEVIGFFAIHTATNSPAAFYGVFPLKILINGKEVLAAQSGDTMTHKEHQKKGLFVKLSQLTFEECRRKGIELLYGLPNMNSYQGATKRLNWAHTDDIDRYDLKLNLKTFPLPKLLNRMNWGHAYLKFAKFIMRKNFCTNVSAFTNSMQTSYAKILRDKNYLDYKDSKNKFFIELDGIVFWIQLIDIFWIGDISDYAKVNAAVLHKIKKLAFKLGYNTIVFHFNKSLDRPRFLEAFKIYESKPVCFYYFTQEYVNTKLLITGADFDTW